MILIAGNINSQSQTSKNKKIEKCFFRDQTHVDDCGVELKFKIVLYD